MAMDFKKIPQSRKNEHEKFKKLAKEGSMEEALAVIARLGIGAAIPCFLDLLETDRTTSRKLTEYAMTTQGINRWARLYAIVTNKRHLPRDVKSMTPAFLHTARQFLMTETFLNSQGIGLHSTDTRTRRKIASSHPFYPEYLHLPRRARICKIARDHKDLGPNDEKQAFLFSLGGLYRYSFARGGTKPKTGTTCFLFVRSVLQAAACNVIGPKTSGVVCSCPFGFSELPGTEKNYGWTSAPTPPIQPQPKPGDIYLIRGASYDSQRTGQVTDSSHVGVIVEVKPNSWVVIEGGATDHVTRENTKDLIVEKGKWEFKKDPDNKLPHPVAHRPLIGWLDIDKINPSQWFDTIAE